MVLMPDALASLMAFLDELGFQATAEVVQESFDSGDSVSAILASTRSDLSYHWGHSDQDTEAKQAFAAARALIEETSRLLQPEAVAARQAARAAEAKLAAIARTRRPTEAETYEAQRAYAQAAFYDR